MAILSNDTPVLGDGCDGLSVDGSRLEFARPDIPVRFHKTLVNGRNNGVFDCFRFAAGMRGLPMDDRYPFFGQVNFWWKVGPQDTPDDDVLIGSGDGGSFTREHVIVPAHIIVDGEMRPLYLHKLGVGGPLCVSGLSRALDYYGADSAHEFKRRFLRSGRVALRQ